MSGEEKKSLKKLICAGIVTLALVGGVRENFFCSLLSFLAAKSPVVL